ncbi:MAG: nitrate ABC transporter substrate-binding protein, partial [Proteobacteria bacterium]|nr:nitrate ABC transporter substrate-binding protein [Pseudomonadota bacterium]
RVLSVEGAEVVPAEIATLATKLEMGPETMLRSINRLEFSTAISLDDVQAVIDYAARLRYIKKSFPAEEIVDTRFMQ